MNLQRFHSNRFVETNIFLHKDAYHFRHILNTFYVNSIGKTCKVNIIVYKPLFNETLLNTTTILLALEKHTIEWPLKISCVK